MHASHALQLVRAQFALDTGFRRKDLRMHMMPRTPVPPLEVDTLERGRWKLSERKPQNFSMLVFYRGLHCPICHKYTSELNGMIGEFEKRGVDTLVLSSDGRERAQETKAKWGLGALEIGYGLALDKAREWGLYISSGRGKTSAGVEEPALFSEPGLFLVRPDGTLYWGNWSTMPFARPHFPEILGAIDFALAKNYPARGEA
ncbi:MAG: peroxiredoxin-like family protein [Burkholderiales bacterium]